MMAAFSEDQINLTALKRIDPKIMYIVDNASQVALYKFNAKQNQWVDIDIEGSLFIYKRCEIPYHGFVIMNRMNTTNLVEPFVRGLEFKKQKPYLMYKNQSGSIYCTWFYELKDYARVSKVIQRIVHTKKGKAVPDRKRSSSESASVINPHSDFTEVKDVISILTEAQQEYDKQNEEFPMPRHDRNPEVKNQTTPLSSKARLMNSVNTYGQKIRKELNAQSRRRFLSGNEVVIDEETIAGQPTFVIGQRHGQSSSHCITNGALDHSSVANGIQTSVPVPEQCTSSVPVPKQCTSSVPLAKQNGYIVNALMKTGLQSALNGLNNCQDSAEHQACSPVRKNGIVSPVNHSEVVKNIFCKNGFLSLSECFRCIQESNIGKEQENLSWKNSDLMMNSGSPDKCTEEVKQSLFHLLQLEASVVSRIHDAHKSLQICGKNSHFHLSVTQEMHI